MQTLLLRTTLLLAALAPAAAASQGNPARTQLASLPDLTLEQLTSITVTSASRRVESLVEAAASLYVISADDIRRSGALTIPEALRLAPNLHVARADANQYVIAARGFSDILTNKLLVLIDGRTAYTPLFSGVFWEAQDTFLSDIDRIEVISGPGATLWGANAVNGVINIITKKASQTLGTYARAGASTLDGVVAARHGGALGGGGSFRVHAKYLARDGFEAATGPIGDDSRQWSTGFRADWMAGPREVTVQGDAYRGEVDGGPMREYSGASLRARYARQLPGGSHLNVHSYYDYTYRKHEASFEETLHTFDVELQHSIRPRPGHVLVWGGGLRTSRDDVTNSAAQAFTPEDRRMNWANAFVQDEIGLAPGLSAILGLKVERNPFTGNEWLPNLRLSWLPSRDSLVWGALSRAVRAPSRLDREVNFPGVPPYVLRAADVFESEVANVAEVGYRTQATEAVSFSATLYHHDYPNLRSVGPADGGGLVFRNDIEGRVSGLESWGTWRMNPRWRLTGGLVLQELDRQVKPGAVDLGGNALLGNSPERMATLRASWNPASNIDFDVAARHVGKLQAVVPAYTAVDVRLAWRPNPSLEISGVARNAFDREHYEWQNRGIVERSFFLHVRWQT